MPTEDGRVDERAGTLLELNNRLDGDLQIQLPARASSSTAA